MEGTVARAFELARSGDCDSLEEVRKKLKKEGFSAIDAHLNGPSLQKQLNAAIAAASRSAAKSESCAKTGN